MKKGILGKKLGMTQIFDDEGRMIPVTVVEAGPCTVIHKKHVRELRLESCDGFEVGQDIKINDMFAAGDRIDVTGITKGKGFQGVIKRWGQSRGPMKHGSMYHRRPGSMSANTNPARVFKGKKLPGHMGVEKVTIQNLDVVRVDADRNLLLVKGAVPGQKGSLLVIKDTVKVNK